MANVTPLQAKKPRHLLRSNIEKSGFAHISSLILLQNLRPLTCRRLGCLLRELISKHSDKNLLALQFVERRRLLEVNLKGTISWISVSWKVTRRQFMWISWYKSYYGLHLIRLLNGLYFGCNCSPVKPISKHWWRFCPRKKTLKNSAFTAKYEQTFFRDIMTYGCHNSITLSLEVLENHVLYFGSSTGP